MEISELINGLAPDLLAREPFVRWARTRKVDADLPQVEVRYVFRGVGIEFICDEEERVHTVFLRPGEGERLLGTSFAELRRELLAAYGHASAEGCEVVLPVLGNKGRWERFDSVGMVFHFQYGWRSPSIELVTVMRADVVPS